MVVLELEAAVTERGQTTVPAAIRKALHVETRGSVLFRLLESGEVMLSRKVEEEPEDPVVGNFLAFLANDMLRSPERLGPVTSGWIEEMRGLVEGVKFDLDQPLSEEDE